MLRSQMECIYEMGMTNIKYVVNALKLNHIYHVSLMELNHICIYIYIYMHIHKLTHIYMVELILYVPQFKAKVFR